MRAEGGTVTARIASPRRGRADAAVILTLAAAVRLVVVLASPGGFTGDFGYDASVYYTASDLLIHGRVPYGDFVLLHPPGLMLVLTPFATLGQLTSDHTGFVVASLAFCLLGAINAAIVVRIAHHCGFSRRAALAGGAFYAVWNGAIVTEVATRLEPLGTFAFLCGLLVLLRNPQPAGRTLVAAGALLGLAATVKIWWIVPVLAVFAWQLGPPLTRRRIMPLALGAAAALVVVIGPFFAAAPTAMWHMVVTEQLGRHGVGTSPVSRLMKLASVQGGTAHLGPVLGPIVLPVVLVLGVLVTVAASRVVVGRLFLLVAVAQLAVLLSAPTYFSYYPGYVAGPFALLIAAGAHGYGSRRLRRNGQFAAGGLVAVIAACTIASIASGATTASARLPSGQLARAVIGIRCVLADSPMALIAADSLSRDIARSCPNWGDVSGRTYGVDASTGPQYLQRTMNPKWQADVRRYLLSGGAVMLIRGATGLSAATRRAITSYPVLVRVDGLAVYRIDRPGAR